MHIPGKLDFKSVGNAFSHRVCCCNCGREDLPQNWLMAKIFPFDDHKMDLNFIVCSEQCRQAFLSHEQLDIAVMLDIVQAARQHGKTLSTEFQNILTQISN